MEIQKVANRAWRRHFHDRTDMKGRVCEIFDELGKLAEQLSTDNKHNKCAFQDSENHCKDLERRVQRVELEKRQLENELKRREHMGSSPVS